MKTTLVIFMGVWFSAGPVRAMLGQPAASVLAEQQYMDAPLRTIANDGYVVQQIEAPDGPIVGVIQVMLQLWIDAHGI